jgi:beta-glucosidase-like glycosyl hydrolase
VCTGINGVFACENEHTLKTMLRGYFNFSGFVVSDWGATHSTSAAISAGLNVQMPNDSYLNEAKIQVERDTLCFFASQVFDSSVQCKQACGVTSA